MLARVTVRLAPQAELHQWDRHWRWFRESGRGNALQERTLVVCRERRQQRDLRIAARGASLKLVDKVASGGERPVSVTTHGNLLYVLNGGGVNNITGFSIGEWGRLKPIPGSSKPLSAAATGPAQVEFDPSGETLVVTEKATNKIDLYRIEGDLAQGPLVRNSNGMTPFGFAFSRRGTLIVSEAFGGAPDAAPFPPTIWMMAR